MVHVPKNPESRLWQRIESIFEQLVEAPTAKHAELLDQLCDDDPELRREVEDLLAADARTDAFLDTEPPTARENIPTAPGSTRQVDEADATEAFPAAIGPYRVEGVLGRGGMGVVYDGIDPELGRRVAIKALPPSLRAEAGAAERLNREARILANLDHPNLATLYGLVRQDGDEYLILEHISGESLQERLRGSRLRLGETLRIAVHVSAGLAAAHEQGIVHRDLKPANIRISETGQVKVLDFGIAKSTGPWRLALPRDEQEASLTRTGMVLGTVAYMSPEQIEGNRLDARADIWAFGCVLFECLAGSKPFVDDYGAGVLRAILEDAPDWQRLPADTPPRLVSLLRRCLRKDRRERLRDMGDARLELEEIRAELETTGSTSIRGLRQQPFRHWQTLVGSALLVAIGLGLGWLWGARSAERSTAGSPAGGSAPLHVTIPLEGGLGIGRAGILAAHGERLAWLSMDRRQVLVRSLTDPAGRMVFDGFAWGLSISADGQKLALGSEGQLLEVSIEGGVATPRATVKEVIGSAWGDDGSIVYTPDWSAALWRAPPGGGRALPITTLLQDRSESSHRYPFVLPGSEAVLYTVKTREMLSFEDAEIAVVDLRSGAQKILVRGGTKPALVDDRLYYVANAQLVAAPFDRRRLELSGPPRVVIENVEIDPITGDSRWAPARGFGWVYLSQPQIDPYDAELRWLGPGGSDRPFTEIDMEMEDFRWVASAAPSPDGRRLVLATVAANNGLWLYDLERRTLDRLTWGLGNTQSPVWTPDGEWITFVREDRNVFELLEKRSDGSGEQRRIYSGSRRILPHQWTPDGQTLLLQEREGPGRDILVLRRGGVPEPLFQSSFDERNPTLSPDGRWLAYNSDESGNFQVYVQPFGREGRRLRISDRMTVQRPLWIDDDTLVFASSEGWMIRAHVGTDPLRLLSSDVLFAIDKADRTLLSRDGEFLVRRQPERRYPESIHLVLGSLPSASER